RGPPISRYALTIRPTRRATPAPSLHFACAVLRPPAGAPPRDQVRAGSEVLPTPRHICRDMGTRPSEVPGSTTGAPRVARPSLADMDRRSGGAADRCPDRAGPARTRG